MGKLIDTSFIPWASSGASSKSGRKKKKKPTTKTNETPQDPSINKDQEKEGQQSSKLI